MPDVNVWAAILGSVALCFYSGHIKVGVVSRVKSPRAIDPSSFYKASVILR